MCEVVLPHHGRQTLVGKRQNLLALPVQPVAEQNEVPHGAAAVKKVQRVCTDHEVLVKHGHLRQRCVSVVQSEWLHDLRGRIVCVCVLCGLHGSHVLVVVAWDSQILWAEHVRVVVLRASRPQGRREAPAVIPTGYILPALAGLQRLYR